MPSQYAKRLSAVAQKEYDRYHFDSENDPPLASRIERYWSDNDWRFPGVRIAWSAVFVSWCVRQAGATDGEFFFSPAHSQFVYRCIQNAANATGVFRAFDISNYAPQVGDIIQNNRSGNRFNFQYAASHRSYVSHSAIVVEVGIDSKGGYATTIGGNESDSIRMKVVRLDARGFIGQRPSGPFISVIQNLK